MKKIGQILADNVQRLMDLEGWTQDKLAEKADVSKGTIQNILYQQTWPRLDQVSAVASALGVDPATLYQDASAIDPRAAWELVGKALDGHQDRGIELIKPSLAATIAGLNDVEAALLEEAVNGILDTTRGSAHPQKQDQPKHKR